MDKSKFNDKKEWKKFGIVLAVILGILGAILWFKGKPAFIHLFSISGFSLVTAFLLPIILKPVFIFFSYFGFGMSWFMTRIILTILFYFVFTPINLFSRLFGKKYLITYMDKKKESYWENVNEERSEKINYERQF